MHSKTLPVAWLLSWIVALWTLLPVSVLLLASFAVGWYWPALFPRDWSFRAWSYMAGSSAVLEALSTSMVIALMVVVLSMAVSLPAARAMALYEFRGKRAIWFCILLPVMAPPLAMAMGLHFLFLGYGLADSTLGVVLAHTIPAAPYCTLMLVSAFSRVDVAYEAVARTLGASPWRVWRHVTLPALAPGFAVAAAFAFLISWSQYLLTLLVGGPQTRTLPLYLVAFQRSGDEAVSAALTLLFLAPALFVFAGVSKFLRENR